MAQLLDSLSDRAPVAADRCRAALSAMFTWAMKQGLAEENPAAATARPVEPKARERVLSPDELRAIWQAAEGPGDFNAIVRLLLLTGQRREEVGAMRWTEVDTRKALWSLPGERTKNGRPHDVPLSDAALALIQGQPVRTKSGTREPRELVFGEGEGGFSGWSKAKAALDDRLAKARAKAAGRSKPTNADRLPDCASTTSAGRPSPTWPSSASQPHVIEAVVNHVRATRPRGGRVSTTARPTPGRSARRWRDGGSGCWGLRTGGEGTVVSLRRAAEVA